MTEADYPYTAEEFLDGIRALSLEQWVEEYEDLGTCDGTDWELTITFSNRHKTFRVGGYAAFPDDFEALGRIFGY